MPNYDICNEYEFEYAANITTKSGRVMYYCEVEADNDEDALKVFAEFFQYDYPSEKIAAIDIVEKRKREI